MVSTQPNRAVEVVDRPLCPTFQTYQFCSFGLDCPCNHGPFPQKTLKDLFTELNQMGLNHTKGFYNCIICGHDGTMDNAHAKVGETESYKYCVQCGNFFFYPHVQVMILMILEQSGTDYQAFKRAVDLYYRRLPAILQPAFMYEAHRWATRGYAWSLTYPENAEAILKVLFAKGDFKRIFSMGSGSGYIEHTFLNAGSKLDHPLEVHAFDAMDPKPTDRRIHFDVVVEQGDVSSLKEYGDMTNSLLLLCWPPFGSQVREESTMAFDCIREFEEQNGEYLIYIGDVNATGDWRFHDRMASHWEILKETFELAKLEVWVPQQMGLVYAGNDSVGIYKKRETPLDIAPRVWHLTA
ncbi:hypothetical protein DIPPA_14870 [Diplonema papillatum]|nr:hypothetical protein DIPPA_14870 [Diplonema papillatum]